MKPTIHFNDDAIKIVIPLEPIAKGRPKSRIVKPRGRSPFVQVYTPSKTKNATQTIVRILKSMMQAYPNFPKFLKDEPLGFSSLYVFERPKSYKETDKREWKITKPDKDNLEKLVMDAISDAGMWGDDKQVCTGTPTKVWGATGERAHFTFTIWRLGDCPQQLEKKK